MFYCCFVATGMVCDLDKSGRKCVLLSPVINDTKVWGCMFISYLLSSDDVKLKFDIFSNFSGDMLVKSHILLVGNRDIFIENKDLGSSVSIQLTASRYLASTADNEYAMVYYVRLLKYCPPSKGRPIV